MAAETKNPAELLKQKVGPLPLWAWLGLGGVVWWYVQKSSATKSGATATNQQTDPAGNVGTIDPATGYVDGTPEDLASLAAQNSGSSSPTTGAGSGATSGAQTYADNNAWGIAAVNYLVGIGIDAVTANQAVQNFLSSQPLTTSEQGDVNLAITALGPPPTLPGPVQTNPNPVTTTGSGTGTGTTSGGTSTGTGTAKATVSNGHVDKVNNNDATVSWVGHNAVKYKVVINGPNFKNKTTTQTSSTASFSGLSAGHDYVVTVTPYGSNGQPGPSGNVNLVTTR